MVKVDILQSACSSGLDKAPACGCLAQGLRCIRSTGLCLKSWATLLPRVAVVSSQDSGSSWAQQAVLRPAPDGGLDVRGLGTTCTIGACAGLRESSSMRDEVLRLAGPVYTSRVQPGVYVRRLEAACQLLHRKLQPSSIAAAQTDSSRPAAHNAPPAGAPPTPSAAGNTAAAELCTLLLTDQEVLDVVLALHDIRIAQLCTLLPITRARLPSPVSSEAFARRLSQRQRSASGDQLNLFVAALERDTIVEGDPLLGVWESMHRAMQLVLAALLSLPIRSRIQHPDSAATTHTSATTQLPPGYHRCSACLLLSLRLALVFNENCIDELRGGEQHLARLHGTLPGLLLGLSTSVTVMQAAGHPEAKAQRVHFVRFLLNLGILQSRILLEDIRDHCQDVATYPTDKVTTSYPDYLAHLLASSPVVTGWPGSPPAKPSYEHSYSTAGASSGVGPTSGSSSSRGWGRSKVQGSSQGQSGKGPSTGSPMDLASVNTYAHVAQALCAVLGRQEEGLIITQLVSMCQAEGPESWSNLQEDAACLASTAMGGVTREIHCLKYVWDILKAASAASRLGAVASCHQSTPSSASSSPLLSIVLSVLPRCLVALQAGVASTRLGALLGTLYTPGAFPGCFRKFHTLLCDVLQLMVELWPHWRCRPAVLRLLTRTAAAGVDGYSTMAMLLDGAPNYEAETRLLSGLKRQPKLKARTPELETILSDTLEGACTRWVLLLSPQGSAQHVARG
ncbi:hypothetical protein V8C86DRAFT_1681290 [Haematococcus lacustris]